MEEKKKESLVQKVLKSKKRLFITAIVLIVGFGIWRYIAARNKGGVESAKVEKGLVSEELVLSGEINADEYAKLTFPTSGKIAWVGVSEGDEVKRGQALTKLDTIVLNAAFQQTRAALRAAEATVEKIHDQVKDHSGDETFAQKDTRTAAEAAKDEAYEAYVAAEYNLRNSTLTAPFAGIVTFLAHPYSGVNVLATETQVELINLKTIYFEVTADQSEVNQISKGQGVIIVLDSFQDEEAKGQVEFIGFTPKVGEVGAVYVVKVRFTDTNVDANKFRIGMTGDAKFILSQKEDVLFVPSGFINSDATGKFVNLGKPNNKVYIETGLEGEERTEIRGEIEEGDTVYD